MYDSLVEVYPFIHSVFALSVSITGAWGDGICLSKFMIAGSGTIEESMCKNEELSDNKNGTNTAGESGMDGLLTKCQHAVLEFFVVQLRLQSWKKMKYWAMIPPLAGHSRGHMTKPTHHPLHGAGCSTSTLWNMLNELFDSTIIARTNVVINQFTVSMAFDNWQQMIRKVWQTCASSSNYLKGVASSLKKDKAILLHVRSMLKSPSVWEYPSWISLWWWLSICHLEGNFYF